MEISIQCANCNYHSRVSAATVAANMLYCQNCGKQIEAVLPRRSDDQGPRPAGGKGGARRPPARNNRPGSYRPAPKRR